MTPHACFDASPQASSDPCSHPRGPTVVAHGPEERPGRSRPPATPRRTAHDRPTPGAPVAAPWADSPGDTVLVEMLFPGHLPLPGQAMAIMDRAALLAASAHDARPLAIATSVRRNFALPRASAYRVAVRASVVAADADGLGVEATLTVEDGLSGAPLAVTRARYLVAPDPAPASAARQGS